MTTTFDVDYEEDVLATALIDTSFLKRACRVLDAHHFHSPQHGWIWGQCSEFWKAYKEQPTPKLLLTRAKRDFKTDEEVEVVLKLMKRLYKRKPKAAAAALDEMTRFVRTVNAQIAMEAAATSLEKGKLEDAYTSLLQLVKHDVTAIPYLHGRWIEEFEQRQEERKFRKEHPEEFTRIPTGFKKVDAIIDGIELGEFGMVMATTGKGKSIMLNNLAYNAVKRGFQTAYFTLEMPLRQIQQRQDARWLRIDYNKFKRWDFKPSELKQIERRLAKVRKQYANLLHVVEMPLRRCNILTIREALDDLNVQYGFRPKLILVDSADHMKGSGQRFESYRLEQAEVYWDLAGLAQEGYAVWTSTHAKAEYATKLAGAEAAAESYDKVRIVDIAMSINEPEKKTRTTRVIMDDEDELDEEKERQEAVKGRAKGKYLELYLAKYRDGESLVKVPLDAEFAKIYISELES